MTIWQVALILSVLLLLAFVMRVGFKWVWNRSLGLNSLSDDHTSSAPSSQPAKSGFSSASRVYGELHLPPRFAREIAQAKLLENRLKQDHLVINSLVEIYERILTRLQPDESESYRANVLNRLGELYSSIRQGNRNANIKRSIEYCEEALRFCTPVSDPLLYAAIQHNLGKAYTRLLKGDRMEKQEQAIKCFQEALRVRRAEVAPLEYAATQYGLATVYLSRLNDLPAENLLQAMNCLREALRFWRPEESPLDYASAQDGLGNAYADFAEAPGANRGPNLSSAIKCYMEALRFRTMENTPLDYAATRTHLGSVYLNLPDESGRNIEQAIDCFEHALLVFTPEESPHEFAILEHKLAYAYFHRKMGSASSNLERAIKYCEETLRWWTPETAPYECRLAYQLLANIHFSKANWEDALAAFRSAIDVGEDLYRAGLSSESKTAETAINSNLYRRAAFIIALLGDPPEALFTLERGKTRLLAEALQLDFPRPDNVSDSLWAQFERTRAAVRSLRSRDVVMLEMEDPAQAYASRERRVGAARSDLNNAIKLIRECVPDFLRANDLPAIESLLVDERTAIVTFCTTEQGSIGFTVVRDADPQVQKVVLDFKRDDLARLFIETDKDDKVTGGWLVAYINYLNERTHTAFNTWLETQTRTLAELSKRLIMPVLNKLPADVDQLIFIPSGWLFLLPLHAAPLSETETECLCDRYKINYAASIKMLVNSRTRARREVESSLYAVINPEQDPGLAFSSVEGEAISKFFSCAKVHSGWEATKQTVATQVQGQSYIHFACHGTYKWLSPLESCLSLADESLTLDDLQKGLLNLSNTRLITLSACESGMVQIIKDVVEEYVGLPAGFMSAGVPCVVSSLWTVTELSTALLMERFYANHLTQSMDFTTAMRLAQLSVRKMRVQDVTEYATRCYRQAHGRDKAELLKYVRHYSYLAEKDADIMPFAHPYYWAAFTVNGI